MADYIFTQNGDGNVQIGDMTGMPYHVNTALKWALEHNFQSVAAQYARTLALEVVRLREDNERLCSALQSSKKRGAAYENTGLTPDEIAALKAENDLLKRTILDMKEQYENPPTRTCTTYRAALTQHDSAQDGREGAEHD